MDARIIRNSSSNSGIFDGFHHVCRWANSD
jgi:hypothetical protein